jgi:small conductance mechanosensitive channel
LRGAAPVRADAEWCERILDEFEIIGVDRWADSAVELIVRVKVVGVAQWGVRREYLRRLKKAFDARGIEIPYPHLTIYPGRDKDGGAPPLRVLTERAEPSAAARSSA